MNVERHDIVLVQARPKPYKAVVERVDRYYSGDIASATVRPLPGELGSMFYGRARTVGAKSIVEVIRT